MIRTVFLLRSDLSAGFLTAWVRNARIRSLVENSTANREFSSSSSTSRAHWPDASPQAISERTSYCRARLEFLLYTQIIPSCRTASGCGPPPDFTRNSPCPYVARIGFGSSPRDEWRLSLAFTAHIPHSGLCKPRRTNSLARSAKSTPSSR